MTDQPSAQLRLAAELAVGLARRLWMTLHYDATETGFCWHMFQSTFVDGCYVLWELGVALAGTGESNDQGMTRQQCVAYAKQHPGDKRFDPDQQALFKFLPAAETRAGVLAYGEVPDALFARLLEAYFDNACNYGPDEETLLYSGQGLFKPTAEFEREIDALVECGYAERCGGMVKWTDKTAPGLPFTRSSTSCGSVIGGAGSTPKSSQLPRGDCRCPGGNKRRPPGGQELCGQPQAQNPLKRARAMATPRAQPDDVFLRHLEPAFLLSKIVIERLNRFTFHNPPTHFTIRNGWRWLFNSLHDARGRGLLKYYRYWRNFKINDWFGTAVGLGWSGRDEVHTFMFNRRDVTAEEKAQLGESMKTARAYYGAYPAFQAAINRLNCIGFSAEFDRAHEDQGTYNALILRGRVPSLDRLEALAADDAGYRSPAERAAAAKRYRIYLLRNWVCNFKDYRERYADVGGSPYDDPKKWPKET